MIRRCELVQVALRGVGQGGSAVPAGTAAGDGISIRTGGPEPAANSSHWTMGRPPREPASPPTARPAVRGGGCQRVSPDGEPCPEIVPGTSAAGTRYVPPVSSVIDSSAMSSVISVRRARPGRGRRRARRRDSAAGSLPGQRGIRDGKFGRRSRQRREQRRPPAGSAAGCPGPGPRLLEVACARVNAQFPIPSRPGSPPPPALAAAR